MGYASNIEQCLADIRSESTIIKGWLFSDDGKAIEGIRGVTTGGVNAGYYGIERKDVFEHFKKKPEAKYSGFTLYISRSDNVEQLSIEVLVNNTWQFATSYKVNHEPKPEGQPTSTLTAAGKVLFIGHDVAQAGAQLLLLRFLRFYKNSGGEPFDILLNVTRAYIQTDHEKNYVNELMTLGSVFFISEQTGAPENAYCILHSQYALIYLNTCTLGNLAKSLHLVRTPMISHIHELSFWIENRVGLQSFKKQIEKSSKFIACSKPVATNLISRCGVESEKVITIHASAYSETNNDENRVRIRNIVREKFGVDKSEFWIVSCGTFDWRKGADLFLPLIYEVDKRVENKGIRASWIGGFGSILAQQQFDYEVRLAGMTGKISVLGHIENPSEIMLAADAFALLSREDPFPLVMLEAASCGLPIVGFRGTGGIEEMAEVGAAALVDYPNIEAYATQLNALMHSPVLRNKRGQVARKAVADLFDSTLSFAKISNLIEQTLTANA